MGNWERLKTKYTKPCVDYVDFKDTALHHERLHSMSLSKGINCFPCRVYGYYTLLFVRDIVNKFWQYPKLVRSMELVSLLKMIFRNIGGPTGNNF